jgi:hypothetical protein
MHQCSASQMSRIGLKSQLSLFTVPSIHFSSLHEAALSCRHHHLDSGRVCNRAAPSRLEDRLFLTFFALIRRPTLPSTCLLATQTIVLAPLERRKICRCYPLTTSYAPITATLYSPWAGLHYTPNCYFEQLACRMGSLTCLSSSN